MIHFDSMLGDRLVGRVTRLPQNSKIAFVDQSLVRYTVLQLMDMSKELPVSAEGI